MSGSLGGRALRMIRLEVNLRDPLAVLDWVSLWAMAVNEETSRGGLAVNVVEC
jgi:L-serine deaminase